MGGIGEGGRECLGRRRGVSSLGCKAVGEGRLVQCLCGF